MLSTFCCPCDGKLLPNLLTCTSGVSTSATTTKGSSQVMFYTLLLEQICLLIALSKIQLDYWNIQDNFQNFSSPSPKTWYCSESNNNAERWWAQCLCLFLLCPCVKVLLVFAMVFYGCTSRYGLWSIWSMWICAQLSQEGCFFYKWPVSDLHNYH